MPDHILSDFSGGWNTRKAPPFLAENELPRADNIQILSAGEIGKRGGYSRIGNNDSDTNIVTGLAAFSTPTGTKHLVRTKNGNIEYYNAGTWTDITAALTITTTGDIKHVFTAFRGVLFATNGTDIPWKWTGSGNATLIAQAIGGGADTIDKARAICSHRERVVLGDVTATESAAQTRYESVIWPSDSGTADTWSASPTGKIHLGQGDGDSITCLLSLVGDLIAFKQNSIWRITDHGSSTQVARKIADVGTPSPHGAVVADGRVFFLSTDALLFMYDPRQGDTPDAVVELTTERIGPRSTQKVTKSRLPYSHLVHNEENNEVVCFLDDTEVSSDTPAQAAAWVYNVRVGAWTRWRFGTRRINVSVYGWDPSTSSPSIMYGSSDGFTLLGDYGGYDTNGVSNTVISLDVITAPSICETTAIKNWRWLYLYTNLQQLDANIDDNPASDAMDVYHFAALPIQASPLSTHLSTTLPAVTAVDGIDYDSTAELRLTGYSRAVWFRLRHDSGQRIRLSGLMVNFEPTQPRR